MISCALSHPAPIGSLLLFSNATSNTISGSTDDAAFDPVWLALPQAVKGNNIRPDSITAVIFFNLIV